MPSGKGKIWVLIGTRPEVIKQIPLLWALCERFGRERIQLISTGQHNELLNQALAHFSEKPDIDLSLMSPAQDLAQSAAKILEAVGSIIKKEAPEWLVVQGDTTTAAMSAWAAFLQKKKVLHNEAGLRSNDLANPFPEEANRKLISVCATIHAAPTELAKGVLQKEGAKNVFVTGNTGIDALRWTLENKTGDKKFSADNYVLITAHRRENEAEFENYFRALSEFANANPDLDFLFPLHPNNLARKALSADLALSKRIQFLDPLDYSSTCHLLSHCRFVVTDSGGIQEEASSLGVPVVVFRKTTERQEAVNAGWARLCWPGAASENSIAEALAWAKTKAAPGLKNKISYPIFGDGQSAAKIAALLS